MKNIFTFIAIFFIGIAIYGNVLDGDFIWDDESFVVNNEYIRSFKWLPQYFKDHRALAVGGISKDSYRPFVPLSYAIDYKIWGLDPFGYHLTNILFHIFNAFFVFWMAILISKRYLFALFCSLIFLVHPVQTEAVSWIAGRGNVLFLFFYLLSFVLYIKYKDHNRPIYYIGSIVIFAISLLCREMAASLSFILILYSVLFVRNRGIVWIVLESLPYFIITIIFVFIRFYAIGSVSQGQWWTGEFITTFLTMITGLLYYLGVLILPVGLCVDHLCFPVVVSFLDIKVIVGLSSILLLLWGTIIFFKKKHFIISFGILWFFITLGPVLNIIPMKILVADRFLYLPMIGYCLVLVSSIFLFFRNKKVRFIILISIVLFYGLFTISRNNIWANEIALYSDVMAKYAKNPRAGVNLALAHFRQGDVDAAIDESIKVISYDKENYTARMQLSDYYLRKNNPEKALEVISVLMNNDPKADVCLRYAKILLANGEISEALKVYKGLSSENTLLYAKAGEAQIYLINGDLKSAAETFEVILNDKIMRSKDPALNSSLYLMLGDIYETEGKLDKAETIYKMIIGQYSSQSVPAIIAKMMIGDISDSEYLKDIKYWSSDLKRVALYFLASKKASLGLKEEAVKYFEDSININDSDVVFIELLSKRRKALL